MLKEFIKKIIPNQLLGLTPPNVEFDQVTWNKLYSGGKWQFLEALNELAHYSTIVGYAQFFSASGRILDVGCGTGILQQRLAVLPYAHYCGVDISSFAIEDASQYCNERTEFAVADASIYEPAGLYDIIIFNESLYCFNDCIPVLKHYQKYLSEAGVFVVSMHVQDVSLRHWQHIDRHYQILDAITLVNQDDTSWNVKVLKPSAV